MHIHYLRRSRRLFGVVLCAALLLPLTAAHDLVAGASGADQAAQRPNVLIIMTDDQRRFGTMDVMPKTKQWLGSRGVEFPNGVVTTASCCPSRASTFSGQYVHNHGVDQLHNSDNLDPTHTVQYTLKNAGYRTGITGKMFNDVDLCADPPSFDRFAVQRGGYYDTVFRVDERTGLDGPCTQGDGHIAMPEYSTTFVQQKAIEFLRDFDQAGDEDPWLLFIHPFAPHVTTVGEDRAAKNVPRAEPRYVDASIPAWDRGAAVDEADLGDKPPHVRDTDRRANASADAEAPLEASVADIRAGMLRTLMSVDDLVGRVRATLEELDEDRNTLIFFFGDNGYLWAEHRLQEKLEAYASSARVPFYARWSRCGSDGQPAPDCPGILPAGTQDPRIAANIDIAPTIYDATGITPEYIVDGKSLFDAPTRDRILLEQSRNDRLNPSGPNPAPGPSAATNYDWGVPTWAAFWSPGQYLYRENYYDPDMGSVSCYDRDPDTACSYYVNEGEPDEYYDLAQDPDELSNQLNDNEPATPARDVDQLSRDLRAARTCQGSECP
ncbi:sulfatase-like hydrolase/transferase [Prauserella flavalba]|uniref:sulfatase-like hydrolase/transferase n=1 Tax=Prauserella flavalba TaxID=1477506 RepID=UPI0036E0724B